MLGWEYPPHIAGGLGIACKGIVEGLGRHAVDTLFVVPRLHGDEDPGPARLLGCDAAVDEPVPGDQPVLEVDAALLPYLGEEDYRRLAQRRRFSGEYGNDLFAEVGRYAEVVRKIARETEFDIVHAHDWMTFPAGIAAAQERGKPLVVHVHSCEYDRAGKNANAGIVGVEQQGLSAADRVVCVSRYTAGQLRGHYDVRADKLRVVHNATPTPNGTPRAGRPPGDPVVLFLGRVTFQKGPGFFLEAAARVVRELPDVKFVMAGSGDLLTQMIERAAALGISRHVHFTGFLRGADVDRMYDQASLYVLPSVSEPFGLAPLEALARDVPVIVSRQSGVSEVLTNVLKVDFWNVEELAGRILDVLRRPELRERLAEGGRSELGRLTWDDQAGLLRRVYEEVAG